MTTKFHIGEKENGSSFNLPIELVTQTVAILAKRGVGKSYTASVCAEEMLRNSEQTVIIDPTGAWWGLRSSSDGKSEGFPVVVIGGDNVATNLPIEEHGGEAFARAIVEQRFSAIIDLSTLRKGESRRFLVPFLETLYRLNREPLHLIIDEADDIAPQKPFGDEAQLLGAVEDIVKRGRKKGIGCTLITQRPADLAKQVLTQCEMLVTLRMTHPRDIKAIEEWVAVHGEPETAETMIKSLPSLPVGTAWFWSPGWGDIFEKVKIRKRTTFDSSATPKPGEKVTKPKKLSEIDIEALGGKIKEAAEKVKENDPKALKEKVRKLELALDVKNRPAIPDARTIQNEVELAVLKALKRRDEEWRNRIKIVVDEPMLVTFEPTKEKIQIAPKKGPYSIIEIPKENFYEKRGTITGNSWTGGIAKILKALRHRPNGLTSRQLGVFAGMSSKSGTFSTYISKLRTEGLIEKGQNDQFTLTPLGQNSTEDIPPLPRGRELSNYWVSQLGRGEGKILTTLCGVYPESLSKEKLAEFTGFSLSGTFSTYLSKLRSLELIEGSSEIRASSELFE